MRWLCAALLAIATAARPSAEAADATPQPDVKKTAQQLEEVMKLLRQGGKEKDGEKGAAPAKMPPPVAKPK